MSTDTSPIAFTFIQWYNSAPDDRGRCSKIASADIGSYEAIPYASVKPGQVHANGKPPHPEYGQWQTGISLSKTSRMLVVDVDDADEYMLSDLETYLPCREATSLRVTEESKVKFHFVIVVPEELIHLWPKQGSTPWGDIKSNGFSYITGVHYTGSKYVATNKPIIVADEDLLEALIAEPRAQVGGQSNGGSAGSWAEPGYRYSEGEKWVRGVADVASMVNQGWVDADINQLMTEILMRSENYNGQGEEVAGWIDSARRKYNLAEGESWAMQKSREEDEFMAALFGRSKWEKRKADARHEAQVKLAQHEAPLAYVTNPVAFVASQAEDEEYAVPFVPDLRPVPLAQLLNPSQVKIEPIGTTDGYFAEAVLNAAPRLFLFATDAGMWIRNEGHVWSEWRATNPRDLAKSLVVSWAQNLISEDELRALAETEVKAARDEWDRKRITGELTDDEISDPPKFTIEDNDDYTERLKRLQKNHARLRSDAGTSAIASMIIAMVRIKPSSCVMVAELDSDPAVIWAGGTPWSLRHPELTVVDEAVGQIHLKNCAVAPAPGPHPLWDEVLEELFPDPEIRAWAIREIAGAALWGSTSKQHPVLDGKPNAGKSTLTDTIRKILGSYAVDVDPNKLIGTTDNSSTEEEKAAMIGARMVLLDEPPKRDRQSISQFNRIASGTGEIAASAKFKNRVSAPKRFNLIINQNHRNRMRLDVEGVKQRIVFIPADGHVPVELYKRFHAGVQAEYPAILATLIRECALFHTGARLPVPLTAQMALDTAYSDGDEFQQWLLSNYEIPVVDPSKTDEDRMPTIDVIRKAYAEHARLLPGVNAVSRGELRDRLGSMNIKIKDHGGSLGKKRNVILLHPVPMAQAYNQH